MQSPATVLVEQEKKRIRREIGEQNERDRIQEQILEQLCLISEQLKEIAELLKAK